MREDRFDDELHRKAIDTCGVFFVGIGHDGVIFLANRALLDAIGCREEDLVGRTFLDALIPEKDRLEVGEQIRRGRDRGETVTIETSLTCHDGRESRLEWRIRPFTLTPGGLPLVTCVGIEMVKPVDGPEPWMSTLRERIAREETENRLIRLNAVLRGIRDVNHLIARDHDPQTLLAGACRALVRGFGSCTIALTNEQGPYLSAYANKDQDLSQLHELLERGVLPECMRKVTSEVEILVIQPSSDLCTSCPTKACSAGPHDAVVVRLAHGESIYGALHVTVPWGLGADLEERDLLRDVAGDLAFALRSLEVETQHKLAVDERRNAEEQLRAAQKMEAVGRLAGGIAHDFNNILTIINSYAAIALDELPKEEPIREEFEAILQAGNRAAGLTRQLLAFSRKQVLQPELINITTVITNLESMLKRVIGEDIDLRIDLAQDLRTVKADPGQIEQVIMNLVVNARDAMPMGGRLAIQTTNCEVNEETARLHGWSTLAPHVMIAVTDTGCGIGPEVQSHLFEPFFTTKEPGKGTGLGLATAYGIVKQSGGSISVHSDPGEGASFKVFLPCEPDSPQVKPRSHETAKSVIGTETILIVEDEKTVCILAERILTHVGYLVLKAGNGEEALRLCEQYEGPIDLLITDVILPQMSGRIVAERLLQLRPELKVLFVSGYTDDTIVRHGVLEKGLHFIAKPFSIEGFRLKVREALDSEPPDLRSIS
jgi:two-component system, cell cycle sensor histidine kinase and response regulator CckA